MKKKLELQTTTLWDYPSQQYLKSEEEKHKHYIGATPSYIIWNLLNRYTKEKDLRHVSQILFLLVFKLHTSL